MADELESADGMGAAEEGGGGILDTVKRYLPLIAGILVVQIIIGFVLVKWVFGPSSPPEAQAAKAGEHAGKAEASAPEAEHKPKKKEKDKKKGEEKLEPADDVARVFDKLDVVTINPAESGGAHYIQLQVHLGLAPVEGIKEEELDRLVESRKSKIMDTIIRIASAKTLDELNTEEGRNKLKEEIRKQVNLFLNDEHEIVKEVYFATFTTQ